MLLNKLCCNVWGHWMLNELYSNLKKMYYDFFKEQQELYEKIDNNKSRILQIDNFLKTISVKQEKKEETFFSKNSKYLQDIYFNLLLSEKNNIRNDNQYYEDKIDLLNVRIKTLESEVNFLNENHIFKRNCAENDVSYSEGIKFNQENINRQCQILDVQEKERQRIARDLHDTSLQNLAHLVHKIELTSMYMDQDLIKAKLELATVNKNLKSIIQDIRNTIFDLRPMIFDDLGLKTAFEKLIDKLSESFDFNIKYEIDEIKCNNSLVLMTIYRIVEECINNALKHSEGNEIIFILKSEKNGCFISVTDNGQSFDCNEVLSSEERHFGLCILKERVDLLTGTINIDSRPGVGTTIKIFIPLLSV